MAEFEVALNKYEEQEERDRLALKIKGESGAVKNKEAKLVIKIEDSDEEVEVKAAKKQKGKTKRDNSQDIPAEKKDKTFETVKLKNVFKEVKAKSPEKVKELTEEELLKLPLTERMDYKKKCKISY